MFPTESKAGVVSVVKSSKALCLFAQGSEQGLETFRLSINSESLFQQGGVMATTGNVLSVKTKYHRNAFEFIFDALRYTQETLDRGLASEEESAHISGKELLEGVRSLAQEKYGLLAMTVLHHWGVHTTEDFGKIVFELIERGEMRKTERDQLSDFLDVYDFQEAFDDGYKIDTQNAFKN